MKEYRIKKITYESGKASYRVQYKNKSLWEYTSLSPSVPLRVYALYDFIGVDHKTIEGAHREIQVLIDIDRDTTIVREEIL